MICLPQGAIRINHGMMNAVYEMPGQAAICKIAGPPTPGLYRSLEREAAACRFLWDQLPSTVPRVLDDQLPGMLLLSFLRGVPPSTFRARLAPQQRNELSYLLGDLLGQIHCINLDKIPATLLWYCPGDTWSEQALAAFDTVATVVECMQPHLKELMAQCRKVLVDTRAWLEDVDDGFVHGDFGGANILVNPDDGSLAGVIDWEWAARADPDLDLARLHWLGDVGRSAHLWTTLEEEQAFYQGYRKHRHPRSIGKKIRWYGLWFATSYLAARLQHNLVTECGPLERFIQDVLNRKW
jgi:aminoglycoside phosphotransferase (APT) family kinase protein